MKKIYAIGSILVFLLLSTGCGAGIIHQTTKKDLQTIAYDDTKNKVRTMFYEGHHSVGSLAVKASIKITAEGFQVISSNNGKQASCEYEAIGDPYVKDWGPAALDSRFGVHVNGCDASIWFGQKESAMMFAQLLYTLKQQAAEDKVTPKLSSGATASVESKTKMIKTDVDKLPALTVRSDIDDLPVIKVKPNKGFYAIVIGIENYRQKLPKADFATADAKIIAEYLTKVMGYPEENVVTLANDHAALGDFVKYFEKWLPNNVEKDSTVFIYYSGHGAPNPRTGGAYLVPYDGDPSFIAETGYSLKRMYDALGKLQAKEIIVALDSCFSGAGGRSVIAKGARPLVMNLESNTALSKNMTVLSASSGEQISSTYDEKGHGLFTYFFLKGIKNEDVVKPDGSIKMDDLFGYIKPQVERIARKQYNNEQSPQLIGAKRN